MKVNKKQILNYVNKKLQEIGETRVNVKEKEKADNLIGQLKAYADVKRYLTNLRETK